MTRRRGTVWSRGLVIAVALVYLSVILVWFAAGYLLGRLLI